MEKILQRIFIVGVLLTASAVAFTPMTSYAAEVNESQTGDAAKDPGVSMNSNFNLKVNKAIQLSGVQGPTINAEVGRAISGELTAVVQSNTNYKVTVKANGANANLVSTANSSDVIPALNDAAMQNVASATGWAMKALSSISADGTPTYAANYTQITTSETTLYSAGTATRGAATAKDELKFLVDVIIQAGQPEGSYTKDLTVTAVAR